MINEETNNKLRELRLTGMATAWQEQQTKPEYARLGFDERLGLLIDAEWLSRHNRRIARHLKAAKLKLSGACLEELEASEDRGLDMNLIRQLATCRWVGEHHNIVLTGATGVGKTFLACGLAQHAIRKGFRALYRRVSRLLDELALARADGSYARVLTRFARADVLVLDDWGMTPLNAESRRDLNEVLEDRWGEKSTIVTSQLPVELWHDQIGDPTTADAICDRLLSKCHRIVLKGPSRRREMPSTSN